MKILLILAAACIAAAYAEDVWWEQCDEPGRGLFKALRISNCGGEQCDMYPNQPYEVEGDIVPGAASLQLRLIVTTQAFGVDIQILNAALPGTEVEPGRDYIIRFTITPSEALAGSTLTIKAVVADDASGEIETCINFLVYIYPETG